MGKWKEPKFCSQINLSSKHSFHLLLVPCKWLYGITTLKVALNVIIKTVLQELKNAEPNSLCSYALIILCQYFYFLFFSSTLILNYSKNICHNEM